MLLRKMSILWSVVALLALSIGTALPIHAQETASAQDEKSESTRSEKQTPDKAVGETKIKLDRRTNTEYEKSAYSFRYKTQSKAKHKNYVDVVYSANGNIRVNNHGGMECKIVDLGGEIGNGFDTRKVKNNDWQKVQIKPATGHYYAYHIQVQRNQMTVVFRVDQLSETQMGITAWYQKGKNRWPLSVASRGTAGASGMNVSRSAAR
jgi:hypothetical protein